jgi:hypothetical protein
MAELGRRIPPGPPDRVERDRGGRLPLRARVAKGAAAVGPLAAGGEACRVAKRYEASARVVARSRLWRNPVDAPSSGGGGLRPVEVRILSAALGRRPRPRGSPSSLACGSERRSRGKTWHSGWDLALDNPAPRPRRNSRSGHPLAQHLRAPARRRTTRHRRGRMAQLDRLRSHPRCASPSESHREDVRRRRARAGPQRRLAP